MTHEPWQHETAFSCRLHTTTSDCEIISFHCAFWIAGSSRNLQKQHITHLNQLTGQTTTHHNRKSLLLLFIFLVFFSPSQSAKAQTTDASKFLHANNTVEEINSAQSSVSGYCLNNVAHAEKTPLSHNLPVIHVRSCLIRLLCET